MLTSNVSASSTVSFGGNLIASRSSIGVFEFPGQGLLEVKLVGPGGEVCPVALPPRFQMPPQASFQSLREWARRCLPPLP
jgi:hypothetical protein